MSNDARATRAQKFTQWITEGRKRLAYCVDRDSRANSMGGLNYWHLLEPLRTSAIPTFNEDGEWQRPDRAGVLHPDVVAIARPGTRRPLGFAVIPNGADEQNSFADQPHIKIKLLSNQLRLVAKTVEGTPEDGSRGVAYLWGLPEASLITDLVGHTSASSVSFDIARDLGASAVAEAVSDLLKPQVDGASPRVSVNVYARTGEDVQERMRLLDRLERLAQANAGKLTVRASPSLVNPEIANDLDSVTVRAQMADDPEALGKVLELWADGERPHKPPVAIRPLTKSAAAHLEFPRLEEIDHLFCAMDRETAEAQAADFARAQRSPDIKRFGALRTCMPVELAKTLKNLRRNNRVVVLHMGGGEAVPIRAVFDQLPSELRPDAVVGSFHEFAVLSADRTLPATVVAQRYTGIAGARATRGLVNRGALDKLRDTLSRQQVIAAKVKSGRRALGERDVPAELADIVDSLRNENFSPMLPVKYSPQDARKISPAVDVVTNDDATLVTIWRGSPHSSHREFRLLLPANSERCAFAATDGVGPTTDSAWAVSLGVEDVDHYLSLIRTASPSRELNFIVGRGRDPRVIAETIRRAQQRHLIADDTLVSVTLTDAEGTHGAAALRELGALQRTWKGAGKLSLRCAVFDPTTRSALTGIVERRKLPENPLAWQRVIENHDRRSRAHRSAELTPAPMVAPTLPSWEAALELKTLGVDIDGVGQTGAADFIIVTDPGTYTALNFPDSLAVELLSRERPVETIQCPPSQLGELIERLRGENAERHPRIAVCAFSMEAAARTYRIVSELPTAQAPHSLVINRQWLRGSAKDSQRILAPHLFQNQVAVLENQSARTAGEERDASYRLAHAEAALKSMASSAQQQENTAHALRVLENPDDAMLLGPILEHARHWALSDSREPSGLEIGHDYAVIHVGIRPQAQHRTVVIAPNTVDAAHAASTQRLDTARYAVSTYFSVAPDSRELVALAFEGIEPQELVFQVDRVGAADAVADALIVAGQNMRELGPRPDGRMRRVIVRVGNSDALLEFQQAWQARLEEAPDDLPIFIHLDDDKLRPLLARAERPAPTKSAQQPPPRGWQRQDKAWHHLGGPKPGAARHVLLLTVPDEEMLDWDGLASHVPDDLPADTAVTVCAPRQFTRTLAQLEDLKHTESVTVFAPPLSGNGARNLDRDVKRRPTTTTSLMLPPPVDVDGFTVAGQFVSADGQFARVPGVGRPPRPPRRQTMARLPDWAAPRASNATQDDRPSTFAALTELRSRLAGTSKTTKAPRATDDVQHLESLHVDGPTLEHASDIVVVIGGGNMRVSRLRQMVKTHRRPDSDVLVLRPSSGDAKAALREVLAEKREDARISILTLPDAMAVIGELEISGVDRVWVPSALASGRDTGRLPENLVHEYRWNNAAFPTDVVNGWWALQGTEQDSPNTLILCADWNAERPAPVDVYEEPHAAVVHAIEPLPTAWACRPAQLRELLHKVLRDTPNARVAVVGGRETHAVVAALGQDEFAIAPSMLFLEHDDEEELGALGLPPATVLAPLPELEDDQIDAIEWYGARQAAIEAFAQEFVADKANLPGAASALSDLVPESELGRGALITQGRAVAYLPTAAGFLLTPQRRIVIGAVDVNQTRPASPWEGVATIVYEPGQLGLADAGVLASRLATVGDRPEQFIVETTDPELAQTVAALEAEFAERVEAEQADALVADAPPTLEELKRTLSAGSAHERGLRAPQWVRWPTDNSELEPGTRVLVACTPSEEQTGLLTRTALDAPTALGEFDDVVNGLLLAREVGPRSPVALVAWPGQLRSVLEQMEQAGERCVLPDALLTSHQDVNEVWGGTTPNELFGHPVAIFSDGVATGAFGKKSVNNTFGLLTPPPEAQEPIKVRAQEFLPTEPAREPEPPLIELPPADVDLVAADVEVAVQTGQSQPLVASGQSTMPKPAPPRAPLSVVLPTTTDQYLPGDVGTHSSVIDQITPRTDSTKVAVVVFARIPPGRRPAFAEEILERFPESAATQVHYFGPQKSIEWEPALLAARENHAGLPLVACLHSSVTAAVGARWARVPVEALPNVVMVREGRLLDEFYRRLPNFVLPTHFSDPLPARPMVEDAIASASRHAELFKGMRAATQTANAKRTFWPGMEIVDGGEDLPGLLTYPSAKVGASERTLLLSSPHMLERRSGDGLTADVLGKVSEETLYGFMCGARRLTVRLSDHPSLDAALSALDRFSNDTGIEANVHVEVQGILGWEATARVRNLVRRNVTLWPNPDRARISEPVSTLTLDVSNSPTEMPAFEVRTQAEHRLVIPPNEDGLARYRERVRRLGHDTRVLARCLPGQEPALAEFLNTLPADELPLAVFVDAAGLSPFADADVPDWLPIIANSAGNGLPELDPSKVHAAIRDRERSRIAHRVLSAEVKHNPTLYEAVRQAGQVTFVPRGHARYGREADSQLFSPALCVTVDDNATPRGAIFSGGSPAFADEAHIFLSRVMPIGFKGRHQLIRRSDVLGDVQPETLLGMVPEQGVSTFRLTPHPALASAVEAIKTLLSMDRPVRLELRESERSAELREAVHALHQHPNSRWLNRHDPPASPRPQSL
ncbi:MAG: hypothetical protein HOQ05_00055 [Corynebacteriales bacterium]|nr:hypothetical protein [Mycobacteriales bacterium]